MGDDLMRFFRSLAHSYEPERLLGTGGMAEVWLARDLRHQRRVAVKLLRPELLVGSGHDRFLREIGFLSELSHPNILPLIDSGEACDTETGVAVPFYTMPYLVGESLRDRLTTKGRLPLDEVVPIVRDVAAALDYAHAAGVVHRDIKPGNILLAGGRAVVADFGIARALDEARGVEPLTETGLRIGTPHYLAPEPSAGPPADQYALACVVHEMFTGSPPFPGDTPAGIMAHHLFDPPPSIRDTCDDCPPGVDAAVQRALAKDPKARYPTAGVFAAAIEHAEGDHTTPIPLEQAPRRPRPAIAGIGLAALALALVSWLVLRPRPVPTAAPAPALDSTRYVILQDSTAGESRLEDELLRDAMQRWRGISVVDPFQARQVLGQARGAGRLSPAAASRLAARLGAGRYVLLRLTPDRDSVRMWLALYETAGNRLVSERRAAMPTGAAFSMETIKPLADSLLLGDLGAPTLGTRLGGTGSLPAQQAFARGGAAIGEWDLTAAEHAFADALRSDADYPQAALWLALVRSWLNEPAARWRAIAMRAEAGGERLSERDRQVAAALRARAEGDMGTACGQWRDLARRLADDFVAQYGLADCLVQDGAVERDRASRSGWRFRSNLGEAGQASTRAFALLPSIYGSLDPEAPGLVREIFRVRYAARRGGRALPPDTGMFMAQATLEGDTLAYVPFRAGDVAAGSPASMPPRGSAEAAERRLHQRQYEAIVAWLDASTDRAKPLAALAEVLEQLGDRSALDTLRRARTLTRDTATAYRLAVAEVFLQLRAAVPDDVAGIRRSRALADSLLGARVSPRDAPFERAALAALVGRGIVAAQLWRQPELTARHDVPHHLAGEAPALLVFAAMGGPLDSLAVLEARVDAAIAREFAEPATRLGERLRWLAPAATYAWPRYRSRMLGELRGKGDPVLDAVAAAATGDSAGVLRALRPYTTYRSMSGQYALTLDAVAAESQVRWDAGDREGALLLLDATLGTLYGRGFTALEDPLQAAGLVRAAALRARAALENGDVPGSRRWRAVVEILWSDADAALAPVVREAVTSVRTTAREGA